MSRIDEALHTLHDMDAQASKDQWLNAIHPLPKIMVTFFYIFLVVSFDKYNVAGLLGMVLYLIIIFIAAEIPLKKSMKRLSLVLFLVCLMGTANLFFDQTVIGKVGSVNITSGMLSMLTLMMKGVFSLLAVYILMLTTSIKSICYGLRLLRVPKIIVTLILLIYRYLGVMLKEAGRISQAYSLRAPHHKGIRFRAWGTLAGQLLLKTINRAQTVYESMLLRGFNIDLHVKKKCAFGLKSLIFLIAWVTALLLLRIFPVFEMAGKLFI